MEVEDDEEVVDDRQEQHGEAARIASPASSQKAKGKKGKRKSSAGVGAGAVVHPMSDKEGDKEGAAAVDAKANGAKADGVKADVTAAAASAASTASESASTASESAGKGGFFQRLKTALLGDRTPEKVWQLSECDLSQEELEELRMLSVFQEKELKLLRLRFLALSGGTEWIAQERLGDLEELSRNPLRHRIAECFDVDETGFLDFKEFVTGFSSFSPNGTREKKLQMAFKMHDYDGDDKVGKDDLKRYLQDVTRFSRSAQQVAEQEKHQEREDAGLQSVKAARKAAARKAAGAGAESGSGSGSGAGSRAASESGTSAPDGGGGGDDVESRILWNKNQIVALKEDAKKNKTRRDAKRVRQYSERIKLLESEGILDKVVALTIQEAASDTETISREDFVRVLGHSDFQAKLMIDLCRVRHKG